MHSPVTPGTPSREMVSPHMYGIASPDMTVPFQPQPRQLIPFSGQSAGSPEGGEATELAELWASSGGKDIPLDPGPRPLSSVSTSAGPTPSLEHQLRASTPNGPAGGGSPARSQPNICDDGERRGMGNIAESGQPQVRKVFVGGIPQEMTQMDVHKFFSQFAVVKRAWLQKYRPQGPQQDSQKAGNHRGFGFVIFHDEEAVNTLLGDSYSRFFQLPDGKKLEVKRAVSSNDMTKNVQPEASASHRVRRQQQPQQHPQVTQQQVMQQQQQQLTQQQQQQHLLQKQMQSQFLPLRQPALQPQQLQPQPQMFVQQQQVPQFQQWSQVPQMPQWQFQQQQQLQPVRFQQPFLPQQPPQPQMQYPQQPQAYPGTYGAPLQQQQQQQPPPWPLQGHP